MWRASSRRRKEQSVRLEQAEDSRHELYMAVLFSRRLGITAVSSTLNVRHLDTPLEIFPPVSQRMNNALPVRLPVILVLVS